MLHAATIVAHADWSVDSRKRWVAVARRDGERWRLAAPAPVGDVATFLARLRWAADGGAVALGVDLPIGLPRAYAAALPERDFLHFLAAMAARPEFFRVCATLSEVGRHRPFYPARGVRGMTRAARRLDLSQAALSQQIAILETEFKTRLLDRSRTGVKATAAGEMLLREAQIIIESWRRHHNAVRPRASLGYRAPAPEVFVPALAVWPAAQPQPATPAMLRLPPRPTLN